MTRPHVALLIETSNAYARGLLVGITSYLREHLAAARNAASTELRSK